MDWQQITSLLVVAITAALLIRHEVRKHQKARLAACGRDCECSSKILETIRKDSEPTFLRH